MLIPADKIAARKSHVMALEAELNIWRDAAIGNRNAIAWHAFKDALAIATTQQEEATHVEC